VLFGFGLSAVAVLAEALEVGSGPGVAAVFDADDVVNVDCERVVASSADGLLEQDPASKDAPPLGRVDATVAVGASFVGG
jgi:hypothetical protein